MNARRRSVARLSSRPMGKILVVCHGNIYRSPFVAGLLREKLAGLVDVRSAGFHAVRGRPSPPSHVAMSAQLGVNLESHRSEIVTPEVLAWADTIVLMDRRNWQALRRMGADPHKLVWLGALGGALEVPDPYGMTETAAWQIVQRLERCTRELASAIRDRHAPASQAISGP